MASEITCQNPACALVGVALLAAKDGRCDLCGIKPNGSENRVGEWHG
jgi:hypothetical protein